MIMLTHSSGKIFNPNRYTGKLINPVFFIGMYEFTLLGCNHDISYPEIYTQPTCREVIILLPDQRDSSAISPRTGEVFWCAIDISKAPVENVRIGPATEKPVTASNPSEIRWRE